jgi:response regulator RpfG family c-di-GMP phosphodiesterase
LGSAEENYAALFLNPLLGHPHGLPLIQAAIKNHPAMPIFYLAEPTQPLLGPKELRSLSVRKTLLKPLRFADLIKAAQSAELAFDPSQALEKAAEHSDPLDQETQASDADFLPISAGKFLSGSACFFDVYVRLKAGKYVKILKAGDAFSADRVAAYIAKGLKNFHLRKETQEAYLKYCEQLSSSIVGNGKASSSVKVAVTANQGEEVTSFLRNHGVDSTAVQHAQKFVDNVHQLASQLKRQRNEGLNKFLDDLEKNDHGTSITMLTAFLTQPLHFEAEKSIHLVGLASLLHDIGLQGMDPKFQLEDERELNAEEQLTFRLHPEKGASLLSGVEHVDFAVVQAVLQHHERRSRTGFPNRIGAGSLNRISEIVGICDEFLKLIHRAKGPDPFDLKTEVEVAIYKEFSGPVIEAFRTSFKL